MSGAQPLEELQKTLEEAGRQVSRDLREAETLKSNPESTIREREQIVSESLQNANTFYKKKEYARAFIEWERACTALGAGEEFRRRVRALKESHENLAKVNRELVDIRQALNQRAAPSAEDTRFVEGSHEAIKGQVKNGYAYLSQQLRAERTPRTLSFWWPVLLALVIVAAGFAGLKVYNGRLPVKTVSLAAPAAPASTAMDDTFLQAQKNAAEKQITALKEEQSAQIDDLRRKAAQSAQADREKIVQLETSLKEEESKNSELQRQVKTLMEDSLNKDRAIASLN